MARQEDIAIGIIIGAGGGVLVGVGLGLLSRPPSGLVTPPPPPPPDIVVTRSSAACPSTGVAEFTCLLVNNSPTSGFATLSFMLNGITVTRNTYFVNGNGSASVDEFVSFSGMCNSFDIVIEKITE